MLNINILSLLSSEQRILLIQRTSMGNPSLSKHGKTQPIAFLIEAHLQN